MKDKLLIAKILLLDELMKLDETKLVGSNYVIYALLTNDPDIRKALEEVKNGK